MPTNDIVSLCVVGFSPIIFTGNSNVPSALYDSVLTVAGTPICDSTLYEDIPKNTHQNILRVTDELQHCRCDTDPLKIIS